MSDILSDLSTPALTHAITANLLEFFRYLGRAAHTNFHADEKFTRWHTRLPHPWFNGVISSQPPDEEDLLFIAETIAYFRAYDVPVFTWWPAPHLPAHAWSDPLLAHGFKADSHTPGLAMNLRTLPDQALPDGLTIVPVEDHKTLKQWVHTFIIGYELPPAWEGDLLDLWAGLGLDLPMRNYLGYLHNQPVATANLFLSAGVAGVQCIATIPEARRRGIGVVLTLAPLVEARALGYRAGILQSSEMGFNVYRRLGFQQLCYLDHFYYATEIDLDT